MSLIRIERQPTRKQLIQFSLIWLGFFSFVGVILGAASGDWRRMVIWIGVGGLMPLFAVLRCRLVVRWVFIGLSVVTFPIGWVLSWVILAIIYFLVVTPIAIVLRRIGKDPMERNWKPDGSYWVERDEPDDVPRYTRQF